MNTRFSFLLLSCSFVDEKGRMLTSLLFRHSDEHSCRPKFFHHTFLLVEDHLLMTPCLQVLMYRLFCPESSEEEVHTFFPPFYFYCHLLYFYFTNSHRRLIFSFFETRVSERVSLFITSESRLSFCQVRIV
jgi:hypothetical protein